MRSPKWAVLCLALTFAGPLAARADIGPIGAVEIATEAYIYGYPLVTFDTARKQQTNVAVPDAEHAPMGQMIRMRSYPAVDRSSRYPLGASPTHLRLLRSTPLLT